MGHDVSVWLLGLLSHVIELRCFLAYDLHTLTMCPLQNLVSSLDCLRSKTIAAGR